MIELSSRFKPSDGVVAVSQAGATVLLDMGRGHYYTLNEVGARIWDELREGHDLASIANTVRGEFDAPLEQVLEDAMLLLGRLHGSGLIENLLWTGDPG